MLFADTRFGVAQYLTAFGRPRRPVGRVFFDIDAGSLGVSFAVDLDLAGAGNTEVVRAKLKTMKALGLQDKIEDILITLGKQYHIIRPVTAKPGLFIYLVLDKIKANLALARRNCQEQEQTLTL